MGKRGCVRIVVSVAIFFSAAEVALAPNCVTGPAWAEQLPSEAASDTLPIRDVHVSDFFVPQELGYVLDRQPPARAAGPTVIHIQEAHVNYEGQKHLIGILERLINDQRLALILVEGGEGDVGLSYLRSYGPPENRRDIAEKYLKAGLISAEEYLDIASDYPLVLWGVERKELYQRNVEAFMETEQRRASLRPALASVEQALEVLKPTLTDPQLAELDAKAEAFDQEALSLGEYAAFLDGLAARHGLSQTSYPHVAQLVALKALEATINLEQVLREQKELVSRLGTVIDTERFEALIEKAQGVKAETVSREEFYSALAELAKAAGMAFETYPSLSGYMDYLDAKQQLKPTALSEELERLVPLLRERLAATPHAKELQAISEELDLIGKLIDFTLSPQEHKRLSALDLSQAIGRWDSFLNAQLVGHGLEARTFVGLEELASNLPAFLRFYELAQARDEALVDNVVAKLQESSESLAVLITGGFHSPTITALLRDRGVGLVVVAPKISNAADSRLYHAVLKYKSGHGSLEDVQAASHPSESENALVLR